MSFRYSELCGTVSDARDVVRWEIIQFELHFLGDRHRPIPQHIDITAHLVVIPAVYDRLGYRNPDDGLLQRGHYRCVESRHPFEIDGHLGCSSMGFVSLDDGGGPGNADDIP